MTGMEKAIVQIQKDITAIKVSQAKTETSVSTIQEAMKDGKEKMTKLEEGAVTMEKGCDTRFDDLEKFQTKVKTIGAIAITTIGSAFTMLLALISRIKGGEG